MTFGKRLKELRQQKGFTQGYCASKINIPRSTWAGYEAKNQVPKDKAILKQIAELLGTTSDYLLGVTNDPEPVIEIKKDIELMKKGIESNEPDLLDIITKTKPHIGGVPIDEETAEILYYQMKALKEKLLRDVQKKNQIKQASACGS